jgi:hypothetical protein
MFKRVLVIALAIFMAVSAVAAQAQEEETIDFGQKLKGELTNRAFEVPYIFNGKANDTVIIQMAAADTTSRMANPSLIVLNSNNDVVVSNQVIQFRTATLIFQVPQDDKYTILATRDKGRSGTSQGEYTLELIKPAALVLDTPVKEEITNRGRSNYYLIQHDGSAVDLGFEKIGPGIGVIVSISRITERGALLSAVSFSGTDLERARVNLPAQSGTYIVTVGRGLLLTATRETKAVYELRLVSGR